MDFIYGRVFLLHFIWLGLLLIFPFYILYNLFDLIHFLIENFFIPLETPLRTSIEIEILLISLRDYIDVATLSSTTINAHVGIFNFTSISLARFVARSMILERLQRVPRLFHLFNLLLRVLKVELFATTVVNVAHILVLFLPLLQVSFHVFGTPEAFASIFGVLLSQLACNLTVVYFFGFRWRWRNRHTKINIPFLDQDAAIVVSILCLNLVLRLLVSDWQLIRSLGLLDVVFPLWIRTMILRHFNVFYLREIFELLQLFGINSRVFTCG